MNLEENFTESFCGLNHKNQVEALEILRTIEMLNKIVTDKVYLSPKRK